jgi:hypothetical protein
MQEQLQESVINKITNVILSVDNDFAKLAQASKQMHTFKYFLARNEKHQEINEKDGTFVNKELYKTIQLISLEEFEATIDRYCEIMTTSQNNPDLWADGDVPFLFQNVKKSPGSAFDGYTARSLTPAGTDYILVPDLHGDIHSLIAFIENLQTREFTSKNDPLKLIKPCRLIFMGDYTDRGLWGVEVIYFLMRLKINNPELVFLLRGNHEDSDMTKALGFDVEFLAKFGEEGQNRCKKKIEDFNNSLPLALYYGSKGDDGINYQRLACHATAEIGYKPERLFKTTQVVFFDRIKIFKRLSEAKALPEFKIKHGNSLVDLRDVCEDFVAQTPQNPHRIGFQWCNIKILSEEYSTYDEKLGFETNEELTLALLDHGNDEHNIIFGLDRGHQHNPNFVANPLMELIQKSGGCATVFKGRVTTLNVSPDSFHGLKDESNQNHLNFTYFIRTTGSSSSNWKEQLCNIPVRTGIEVKI